MIVRYIAIFLIVLSVGAYASFYVITEQVEVFRKAVYQKGLEKGSHEFRLAMGEDSAPLVEKSNLLARYTMCELDGVESDALATVLVLDSLQLGTLTKQTHELIADTLQTTLSLYTKLDGKYSEQGVLNQMLVQYCETNLQFFGDCSKIQNLAEKDLSKHNPKCT
ncbi:hypothetical protein DLI08_24180 [Vibrio parahaemolyticus]|nr:hypothetical protein [Vibrio parahaemolyticus]EGX6076638.1 hypothetical protein [Vibrio parahaemolyticus]EKG9566023.1 hypothetical protein [Vibrio parahaemolyticus]EKG9666028.1 hypothetical protein [Vibrio parahaemolyticus]EKG9671174.1 hypothetical protein [Vibrio parahaemolyticus]